MLEPPCWAAAVPSETPGAPATLNPTKEVSSSHTRLKNTPATTHTLAAATKPIRARFFANTRMQNGMRMPTTISNQKNGAVAPVAMMASVSAPAAPGYAIVSASQPTRNPSTATHTANRPARFDSSFLSVAKRPDLLRPMSESSSRARPESMADTTNSGAMMAEYQPSRAISRPKIHAVTECTRMATGRAKRDTTATLACAPGFFDFMKYRYTTLMTRYNVMTQISQNRGDIGFGPVRMRHTRPMPPRSISTNMPAQQMHTVDRTTAGSATFLYSATWNTLADEATMRPPADRPTKNMKHVM